MMWTFVFFTLAYLKVPAESLKDLHVHIPETVIRGHNAVFNCTLDFDEDETLYAIKWYRGTYEIFRYIPSDEPPTKRFPLAGYNVSMLLSTGYTMVLNNVQFVNSGNYSCEAVAEHTFHTKIDYKPMLVIDLPDGKPTITGVKEKYDEGKEVSAICTSWQSNPPVNLSWFINGEPARETYLKRHDLREEHDGTFTSVLQLNFKVANYHFIDGKMTLKCTSSMLSVYWQSREAYIIDSSMQSNQISDLVRGGKFHKGQSSSEGKEKEWKPNRPSFQNKPKNKKPKTDIVQQGSTNNNKVEGLTHHGVSSSSKLFSSQFTSFPVSSVIQLLIIKRISIPHFVVARYPNILLEYLFWIFSVLFLTSVMMN